jgi:predicted DNA-binding antitoxin AbrB/MazE fold protein
MMIPHTVHATFENGLFRPDELMNLPPQTRVKLTVEPMEAFRRPTESDLDEFDRYCDDNPVVSREPYLTRDELHDRR